MATKARIRLSSTDVNSLNNLCESIKHMAADGKIKYAGPIPLPTKKLKVTTRKSTDGEGTATWDRWEMRIHKRVIDLEPNERVMRQIMRLQVPDGLNIEIEVKT